MKGFISIGISLLLIPLLIASCLPVDGLDFTSETLFTPMKAITPSTTVPITWTGMSSIHISQDGKILVWGTSGAKLFASNGAEEQLLSSFPSSRYAYLATDDSGSNVCTALTYDENISTWKRTRINYSGTTINTVNLAESAFYGNSPIADAISGTGRRVFMTSAGQLFEYEETDTSMTISKVTILKDDPLLAKWNGNEPGHYEKYWNAVFYRIAARKGGGFVVAAYLPVDNVADASMEGGNALVILDKDFKVVSVTHCGSLLDDSLALVSLNDNQVASINKKQRALVFPSADMRSLDAIHRYSSGSTGSYDYLVDADMAIVDGKLLTAVIVNESTMILESFELP